MKIIKVVDGFITNSSTNTTIVLLAIKKNQNLHNLIQSIGFPADYPLDFLDFETDQKTVMEFLTDQEVDIAYLCKDYDLVYNIIQDCGPNNEAMEDEIFRYDLVYEMVEELASKLPYDIKVLDYGDCLHNGFEIETISIYSKEEIKEIFKTDNLQLIRSLVNNQVLDTIPFTKKELSELTQNLQISIMDLLEKPYQYNNSYQYEIELYKVFGVEYLKSLLKMVELHPNIARYVSFLPWGLNKFKISLIRKKVSNSFYQMKFEDMGELYSVIYFAYTHFGARDIIHFFFNPSNIEIISQLKETDLNYIPKLEILAKTVIENQDQNDVEIKKIIEKLHLIILDKIKLILMYESEIDNRTMRALMRTLIVYEKENRLGMISHTIASIPQKFIDWLPTSPPGIYIRKIRDKVLK
ncbi:MAG TPA: hypothetical protein ENI29_04200 [bacterium]|nr:hypothetical protein [archaeon]HEC37414.1 hypothetical protein [bacterium]